MKKNKDSELRSEYNRKDLGVGVRGKYFDAYQKSHNVVLLKPEIAKVFPTDEDVNNALASLIKIARNSLVLEK